MFEVVKLPTGELATPFEDATGVTPSMFSSAMLIFFARTLERAGQTEAAINEIIEVLFRGADPRYSGKIFDSIVCIAALAPSAAFAPKNLNGDYMALCRQKIEKTMGDALSNQWAAQQGSFLHAGTDSLH